MVVPDWAGESGEERDRVPDGATCEEGSSAFEVPSWPGASAGRSSWPLMRLCYCISRQVTIALHCLAPASSAPGGQSSSATVPSEWGGCTPPGRVGWRGRVS